VAVTVTTTLQVQLLLDAGRVVVAAHRAVHHQFGMCDSKQCAAALDVRGSAEQFWVQLLLDAAAGRVVVAAH
jgi:hypothetical protein